MPDSIGISPLLGRHSSGRRLDHPENPQKVVSQGQEETGGARITPTTGSAAELVINTAGLMLLCTNNMQPAGLARGLLPASPQRHTQPSLVQSPRAGPGSEGPRWVLSQQQWQFAPPARSGSGSIAPSLHQITRQLNQILIGAVGEGVGEKAFTAAGQR